jgi:hypothetical protein
MNVNRICPNDLLNGVDYNKWWGPGRDGFAVVHESAFDGIYDMHDLGFLQRQLTTNPISLVVVS